MQINFYAVAHIAVVRCQATTLSELLASLCASVWSLPAVACSARVSKIAVAR